jgi:hypothetical protein
VESTIGKSTKESVSGCSLVCFSQLEEGKGTVQKLNYITEAGDKSALVPPIHFVLVCVS